MPQSRATAVSKLAQNFPRAASRSYSHILPVTNREALSRASAALSSREAQLRKALGVVSAPGKS